jgi:hypothetical protein
MSNKGKRLITNSEHLAGMGRQIGLMSIVALVEQKNRVDLGL